MLFTNELILCWILFRYNGSCLGLSCSFGLSLARTNWWVGWNYFVIKAGFYYFLKEYKVLLRRALLGCSLLISIDVLSKDECIWGLMEIKRLTFLDFDDLCIYFFPINGLLSSTMRCFLIRELFIRLINSFSQSLLERICLISISIILFGIK